MVIAQYFGRPGFIVAFEDLARDRGAPFVEVILAADAPLAIDRFRSRRFAFGASEDHVYRDLFSVLDE